MNLGARMLLGYAEDMRVAKVARHACGDCMMSDNAICSRHAGNCATCGSENVAEATSVHEDGVRGWSCSACLQDDLHRYIDSHRDYAAEIALYDADEEERFYAGQDAAACKEEGL